jgi:hypothetical protein
MTSAEAALAARVLQQVTDPRPEYTEDSGPWSRLFRLVYLLETLNEAEGAAPGPSARDSLSGVLHGFRSGGARLRYDPAGAGGRGSWRLAPRLSPRVAVVDDATGEVLRAAGETLWETVEEYREDTRTYLLPHRALLGRLLVELPAPGPFADRGVYDPARMAYEGARRRGFPRLRLRSGRAFGPGEAAWWRDVGRAEGERDAEALYRVARSFDLGDEDGARGGAGREAPAAVGLRPAGSVEGGDRQEQG